VRRLASAAIADYRSRREPGAFAPLLQPQARTSAEVP